MEKKQSLKQYLVKKNLKLEFALWLKVVFMLQEELEVVIWKENGEIIT